MVVKGLKKITPPYIYQSNSKEKFSFYKTITFPIYYITLTVFLLIFAQISLFAYMRKININSIMGKEKENNKEEAESIFDDFEQCSDKLERWLNIKNHDDNIKLLVKLNDLVDEEGEVNQAKILANKLGVDTKKIERMLRKLFGSGSVIKYQKFYLEYSMIKQDLRKVERDLIPENQI
ncbi:MAG: hypothetical protein AAGB12_07395 [Pseudomonadota bacterium]